MKELLHIPSGKYIKFLSEPGNLTLSVEEYIAMYNLNDTIDDIIVLLCEIPCHYSLAILSQFSILPNNHSEFEVIDV